MEQNTPQIIKTIGEHGEEIFMKLQEIVTIDDKDYALLSIVEEDTLPTAEDNEEDEVVVMRMIKTEDDCVFEIIEDDEEYNSVVSALQDEEEIDE